MAGFAKTSQFMLSTATIMVGPMDKLHELTPAEHSLGLVKNFTMTSDPTQTELTQGVTNEVVFSMKTGDGLRASAEVYEYTARNLAYSAGLDGSVASFDPLPQTYLTANASTSTSIELTGTPTGIVAGDYVYIQAGTDDHVHVGRVDSFSANTITLQATHGIPVGMSFPAGSRVGKFRAISSGADTPQATLAAKVVGVMPADNKPVVILFPKMKITRGFNLAFATDNFGNMPFEFTPYALTGADEMYPEFGTHKFKLLIQ